MISYVKHQDLDVEKYDACIENASNSRIYAFSWYLDIVTDHWDALILNDYEAVMPLPWRRKFFIYYIYPPAWTQQLGVFSSKEIDETLLKDFINAIPKKFKKITIQFNSGNPISGKQVTEKVNYILKLNQSYEELFKKFRKDRRERIKKNDEKNNLTEENLEIEKLFSIFKTNYHHKIELSEIDYLKLKLLIKKSATVESANIKIILDKEDDFIRAGAVFLINKERIIYLFSSQTDKGRKANSLSSILNKLIKENSNSGKILDFEGSMLPNIADFFKSFGAEKELYFLYQKPLRYLL
ncbi:MAG: hypothetical protein Q8J84_02390 [Flavobacteriaceae bacterium]|nr:hypothetical protein [Flavobacteriaceae bacterium]